MHIEDGMSYETHFENYFIYTCLIKKMCDLFKYLFNFKDIWAYQYRKSGNEYRTMFLYETEYVMRDKDEHYDMLIIT